VRSHALFTDWTTAPRAAFEQCAGEGYTAVKLKIGRDPESEAKALNRLSDLPLRWRLDANASLTTGGGASAFIETLVPDIRRNIESLEDPFPYDASAWSAFTKRTSVPLAIDWELPSSPPPWPGAQILVIKPSSQDAFPLALAAAHAGMELVVTHSMDHPLGQSVALWTAMRLRQRHGELVRDGGLQAVGLYAPSKFNEQIQTCGPQTIPPPGTGFGFDELLAKLPWTLLH
jgi:O-succinylbenzoate synthase